MSKHSLFQTLKPRDGDPEVCREGSSLALGRQIFLLLSRDLLLELSEKSFAAQEEFFPIVSHIQKVNFKK